MDDIAIDSAEVRRLLDDIADGARQRERDRVPPFDAVDVLRKAGFGAITLPIERGGSGAKIRELLELVLRISEIDPNLAHIVRNHFVFVHGTIRGARGDLPPRWEAEVLGGALFGQGFSEASGAAGSDVHATTLVADGDGYRLDGTKLYSTGNIYADWLSVRATAPDGTTVTVLVPAHRDGVEHVDDWDGIGQQLTGSGTTHFRSVRVDADEVVPASAVAGGGSYTSTLAQLYLTSIIAGILRAIAADAVGLVRARTRTYYHAPSPHPVEDPILQQVVGRLVADAFAAEAVVLAAADALDEVEHAVRAGRPDCDASLVAALQAAKAKVVVDDIALKAASNLFDAGGASAVTHAADLDRHWRNIRTLASHNPSHYKSRILGRYALEGMPPPDRGFF